jgi:hypothetical protein
MTTPFDPADPARVDERSSVGRERLDVPIGTVAPSNGERRRARLAVLALVAVFALAIGLALASNDGRDGQGVAAAPSTAASAAPTRLATSAPGSRSTSAAPGSRGSRVEVLPDLPNVALEEAGRPALVTRHGPDADVLAWTTGDVAPSVIRTFPNAFGSADEPQVVSLAPDGRSLLVATIASISGQGEDRARLLTENGIAWDGEGVTGLGGAVWTDDGRRIALGGAPNEWVVVDAVPGSAAAERRVTVGPTPVGSPQPFGRGDGSVHPVAFSSDGAVLYGATYGAAGDVLPAIRIEGATGAVTPIDQFPAADLPRTIAEAGGRTLGFGPNSATPGGPPAIVVTNPDGGTAFHLQTGVVLGAAWGPGGTLLILDADGLAFPTRMRLIAVDENGSFDEPLFEAGSVGGGGLIGVRNGYVGLLTWVGRPTRGIEMIVVRLADGATAGVRLEGDDAPVVLGSGWLP